jgi:hypothetical protein
MGWWAGMTKWQEEQALEKANKRSMLTKHPTQEEEAIMRKVRRASTEKITRKQFPSYEEQEEYDRWAEHALQRQIAQAQSDMCQRTVGSNLTTKQVNELMNIIREDMELKYKYDTLSDTTKKRMAEVASVDLDSYTCKDKHDTLPATQASSNPKQRPYTKEELDTFAKLKELKFDYKAFKGMSPPGYESYIDKNYQYVAPDLTNEDTIKDIPEELI